ncbi:MAG: hypothetical protein U5K43_03935 [Halofilum sp. (in: g-proteobacteria)]|nr:hypothetical protein [Halofilum sp. (in: g-proteobacteria)]
MVLPVAWIGRRLRRGGARALAGGAGRGLTRRRRVAPRRPVPRALGHRAGYLLWFARPLRDVWIRGDQLRVRGLFGETSIPLDAIDRVEDSRYLRPKLIHVFPGRRPGLPERVTFIPALRRFLPVGPHPVMRELHAAVGRDDEQDP